AWQIVHRGAAWRSRSRSMAAGKSGVARSVAAARIAYISQVPVDLDEEGVGPGGIGGAADEIAAHVQVRHDEPRDSAPPAGGAAGGRTEVLGRGDEVHAAQDLQIGLQPAGMARRQAGIAER